METIEHDRRSEARMRITTPVLFTVEDRMHLQSSYDISTTGIAVACPYRPPVGTSVHLRFTHPRLGGYVSAEGMVVHVTSPLPTNPQHRVGIKFVRVIRPLNEQTVN